MGIATPNRSRAAGSEGWTHLPSTRHGPAPGLGRSEGRPSPEMGVGVALMRKDIVGTAVLDDAPEIHDHHPVAEVANCRQIVGDHQIGQPMLRLQISHYIQDFTLNRNFWPRRGLVRDDQPGVQRKRPRHPNAPRLTARKMMEKPQ